MKITLLRIEESEQGTIGVLLMDGEAFCCTLEPPDKDNQSNISCIPSGTYLAMRVDSPKYGNTFEITKVPNRSHVLIHPGNLVKHTKGCVLLGQYFGKLKGARAVLNSGTTFKAFLKRVENLDSFEMKITEVT